MNEANFPQQQPQVEEQEYVGVQPARAELAYDAPEQTEPESQLEAPQTSEAHPFDGIDLSMLEVPAPQPEQDVSQLPGYEQFSNDFRKFTGIDLQNAVQLVGQLQAWQVQQQVKQQESELQQSWGVQGDEFKQRLEAVRTRFKSLPKDLQYRLDNPMGAQLIWAKLQQEEQAKQKQVPRFDRTGVQGSVGTPKHMYTQQQILNMSNDDYEKQASRIAYAYKNGLVKF